MTPSPDYIKSQFAADAHSPQARAIQKLLHSLDALITTVITRSKGISPSGSRTTDVIDSPTSSLTNGSRRIATQLCNRLQSLVTCLQKVQRTAPSRIDEEVEASYVLEIN